jgi:hypothetical protein
MAYWAACRLQPNRAALALHFLNLQGYEIYCPRLRELRVLRGRPGYTFLRVVTDGGRRAGRLVPAAW